MVLKDHKSLQSLLQHQITTLDQQHWLDKLLGFEFEIKFKPGITNVAAYALSRKIEEGVVQCLLPVWLDCKEVQHILNEDAPLG